MEEQELSLGPVEFNWSIKHLRGDAVWAVGHEFVAQEGRSSDTHFVIVKN